ncbi:sugar phosphate isomerase/epimerase [Halanaerobium sp. ST460_2HS_T2]|jgi:sugar phosphate isomerase/epimerase|uniref:sugar phosphate isomerase/epimerase family protein n=1 Tax=Halanaerobium sp. ST460_2HS_T2 TaxID=2183914 RepID=UPI000E081BA6|nr:sugar phosphate isomerase/epimerase family protein [Halanaerobium sp. ST460_2HS_T2]RCW55409.1 sugar phosphate isomerase/epimerase [Halanaerobium sp. ST460_2HS_T2]
MMKLSFSTLACTDWSINKVINYAVENNYDGVELRAKEPHLSVDYSQEERKKLKELFEKNKLEIPCITAYTRFGYQDFSLRQENIEQLKKMIDLAADIGADYIRTFGPAAENSFGLEDVIAWIRESFLEIDDYAADRGVKVLLETHDDLCQGKDLIKIFENSGLKSCGILWDVAHSVRAGEEMSETISYIKDYIYHVHLKDWINLAEAEDHYVLLGAGELELNQLLSSLNDIDYSGYLSLEWEKMWHPEIEESEIAITQYSQKIKNDFLKNSKQII